VNSNGTGPASLPSGPITAGAPSSPRNPTAKAKTASALVGWTPPITNNGTSIVGYVVTPYLGGIAALAPTAFSGSATSGLVPNLTTGKSYTFTVTASNDWGVSPPSIQTGAVKPT
jgi:hypothetical protein